MLQTIYMRSPSNENAKLLMRFGHSITWKRRIGPKMQTDLKVDVFQGRELSQLDYALTYNNVDVIRIQNQNSLKNV